MAKAGKPRKASRVKRPAAPQGNHKGAYIEWWNVQLESAVDRFLGDLTARKVLPGADFRWDLKSDLMDFLSKKMSRPARGKKGPRVKNAERNDGIRFDYIAFDLRVKEGTEKRTRPQFIKDVAAKHGVDESLIRSILKEPWVIERCEYNSRLLEVQRRR